MEKKIHDKKKEDQGNFSIAILNFLKKKKIIVVSFRSRSYNFFDSILSAWGGVI